MKNNYISLIISVSLLFNYSCSENKKTIINKTPASDTAKIIQPAIITQPSANDTDDPAIWINHLDPSESLILGTDKGDTTGGIYVYNLKGIIDTNRTVKNIYRPNNIDIEYGFIYNGKSTDIAVFSERGRNKIRVYSLPDMQAIDNGGIEAFENDSLRLPMGVALYKDPKTSEIYVFASRKNGPDGSYIWQYRLIEAEGVVSAEKVREFGAFSGVKEIEAIAVDDELGYVYYSDETVGVRQYYASPDSSNEELALFATSGFTGDQEGLSICCTNKGEGYIIVSDQEANKFHIFSRQGTQENPFNHRLLKVVELATNHSDGSDLSCYSFNETFQNGIFIAMSDNRTFQFYKLEDIVSRDSAF